MRLGITDACYQWFGMHGMHWWDVDSAQFDWLGFPKPYFLTTPNSVTPGGLFEFVVGRCIDLGAPVVHANLSSREPDYLKRMKDLLTKNNLEMVPAIGVDIVSHKPQTQSEIDKAISELQFYKDYGDVEIAKFCMVPMIHNRFRNDPPIKEQIQSITENIRPIVKAAEKAGIVLAFENHLDYRCKEIVQIIEAVKSPNLMFLFDTANTFSVCEDPVEAAEVAAPYTVLVHLKDARVVPWSPSSMGYFAACFPAPLGQGNVDNDTIVDMLYKKAPDPENLRLVLELTVIPPNNDADVWVSESIKYAHKQYAKYLK